MTRGQHFHLHKIERFVVLRGTAEIALRRLFGDRTVRFSVSGDAPSFVDMPTFWVHSIRNTGQQDLLTLFWTNEVFDPKRPDTYYENVE
jgi:UDP-2-acetamido-2,6-beta-L-arabino-hexul-4-ose reductase